VQRPASVRLEVAVLWKWPLLYLEAFVALNRVSVEEHQVPVAKVVALLRRLVAEVQHQVREEADCR